MSALAPWFHHLVGGGLHRVLAMPAIFLAVRREGRSKYLPATQTPQEALLFQGKNASAHRVPQARLNSPRGVCD